MLWAALWLDKFLPYIRLAIPKYKFLDWATMSCEILWKNRKNAGLKDQEEDNDEKRHEGDSLL